MNRKVMRKSTLISSIAMLLVAVLALSGVTFAWFSTQLTAETSKIELKASAASGLYVAGTEDGTPGVGDWSSNLRWGEAGEFNPASAAFYKDDANDIDQLTTPAFYFTTTDKGDGTFNGATVTDVTSGTESNDKYYVKKHVWVASDSSAPVKLTMELDIEGSTRVGYERMAIVDVTDEDNPVLVHSTGNEDKIICFTATGRSAKAIIGFTKVNENECTISEEQLHKMDAAPLQSVVFNNVTITKDNPKHFVVYFWFEGQDSACYNLNSGAVINCNITFSLPENG